MMGIFMQVDTAVCGTNKSLPFSEGSVRSGRMFQWVRAVALRLDNQIQFPEPMW